MIIYLCCVSETPLEAIERPLELMDSGHHQFSYRKLDWTKFCQSLKFESISDFQYIPSLYQMSHNKKIKLKIRLINTINT